LIILQNFINGFKIGLTLMLTITYFIIQIIYSNQKKNNFLKFNRNLESIEQVYTESYISYLNLKKEIFLYSDFYYKNKEEINNNILNNYNLKIQDNKNYTYQDFSNLIMEVLKDFSSIEPDAVENKIYYLYSSDACEILYNLGNKYYNNCIDFWSGVISKGLQQTIIEMGSQFSILLSSFSLINTKSDSVENVLNNTVWKNFDYFMINYLFDSFQKNIYLFNDLRIKFIEKNKIVFDIIFYSYIVAYFVLTLIYMYFIASVINLFNKFLNFIAIIPVNILIEDRDINDEIMNLSKKLI